MSEAATATSASPPPTAAGRSPAAKLRHPLLWVPTLYIALSLPYNAVTLVSQFMYQNLGRSDAWIAFWTSWLMLPWVLKPFWAPFLEMYKTKKLIVLTTQAVAAAGFAAMALLLPMPLFITVSVVVLFMLAFNSATHDIAADGLYIDALDTETQAKYIGFQGAFWNIGAVLMQGVFVVVAGKLSDSIGVRPAWMFAWGAMACVMLLLALYHSWVLPKGKPAQAAESSAEVARLLKDVFITFFEKKSILILLAFALLYRSAEGQIETIARLFMLAPRDEHGLGLGTAEVGLAYGTGGTLGNLVGAMLGGMFAAKRSLRRALLPLCLIFNIPNALFTYLAFNPPEPFHLTSVFPYFPYESASFWIVTACAMGKRFALGFGWVSLSLVMMQRLAPGKYSMAHYGFATAIFNMGVMLPAETAGFMSDWLGYRGYFVYILIAAIPSLIVTLLVLWRETAEWNKVGTSLRARLERELGDPAKVTTEALDAAYVKEVWESKDLPEGALRDVSRKSATALGMAILSLYFFGTVVGLNAIGVSTTIVAIYVVMTAGGLLLTVQSLRTATVASGMIGAAGTGSDIAEKVSEIKKRILSARVVAIVAMLIWGVGVSWLARKYFSVSEARETCRNQSDIASCELVCGNDSDYATCRKVGGLQMTQFVTGGMKDRAVGKAAVEAIAKALGEGCSTNKDAKDCDELAKLYGQADKDLVLKAAGVEVDLHRAEEALRQACELRGKHECPEAEATKAERLRNK